MLLNDEKDSDLGLMMTLLMLTARNNDANLCSKGCANNCECCHCDCSCNKLQRQVPGPMATNNVLVRSHYEDPYYFEDNYVDDDEDE